MHLKCHENSFKTLHTVPVIKEYIDWRISKDFSFFLDFSNNRVYPKYNVEFKIKLFKYRKNNIKRIKKLKMRKGSDYFFFYVV